MKIHCRACKIKTNHEMVKEFVKDTAGSFEIESSGDTVEYSIRETFQIIQCKGCEAVSFRRRFESDTFDEEEDIYPRRSPEQKDRKGFYYQIPINMRLIYGQTIDAYNLSFRHLCAAGIRMLVESVCLNKSIISGSVKNEHNGKLEIRDTLEGKINGLVEKNILSPEQSKILHETRILGNEALHELREPELSELNVCIEVVEHVIESLYILPHKVSAMKLARNQKS